MFLGPLISQVSPAQLQSFANPALFNLSDSTCIKVAGEWIGEETEYLDDKGNQKGKYVIRFMLNQQGNKVWGNSFISFGNGQSFGNMKIRGMVAGTKLYFEEYEVVDQRFADPGVIWCMRTGELDFKLMDQTAVLEGGNYKGYAEYYYFECTGKVSMNLQKALASDEAAEIKRKTALKEKQEMQLHPNPASHEVTVTFKIAESEHVRIDLFTSAGELIANVTNELLPAGTHQKLFDLGRFAAGVYLVRMQTKNEVVARYLVIAR